MNSVRLASTPPRRGAEAMPSRDDFGVGPGKRPLALTDGFAVACPRPIHRRQGEAMSRGPKPAKSNEAKPPVTRESPKNESARVRDLEKRLAEALRDKAEAQKREVDALERETA